MPGPLPSLRIPSQKGTTSSLLSDDCVIDTVTYDAYNICALHFPISNLSTSLDWKRQTLFRGFKVCGWGGIFSPGAPGFPYVFRMPNKPQVRCILNITLFCLIALFCPEKCVYQPLRSSK